MSISHALRALALGATALLLPQLAFADEGQATNPKALITTSLGEIEVELFADAAPKTVENFVSLAEGTRSWKDPKSGDQVQRPFYDGLVFHRVIAGFMIQGGCPMGNGMGGPGYSFEDEINGKALGLGDLKAFDGLKPNFGMSPRIQERVMMPIFQQMGITSNEQLQARMGEVTEKLRPLTVLDVLTRAGHSFSDTLPSKRPLKGCLAMANSGPNTNGSQFFINLEDTPHLTGLHTVFGKVTRGFDVVEKIGQVRVDEGSSRPVTDVTIVSIRTIK